MVLLDSGGSTQWQKQLSSKVKSLDIAADGSWLAVTTYDEKLSLYDHSGKLLWTKDVFCRPQVLITRKQILCVYDDDTNPRVAFEVYSESGERLQTQKVQKDLLEVTVSPDERWIAFGLVGGEVTLLDSDWKAVLTKRLGGEVVDLDLSSGDSPTLAVLMNQTTRSKPMRAVRQRISLSQPVGAGGPGMDVESDRFGEKITLSEDGNTAILYGNSSQGQILAAWQVGSGKKWVVHESRHADFASLVQVGHDSVVAGFENIGHHSALFGFDLNGRARWTIPLTTNEGAYLYANRFSTDRDFLVIATDEGSLRAYEIR
jgi:WD40 repeat protein